VVIGLKLVREHELTSHCCRSRW